MVLPHKPVKLLPCNLVWSADDHELSVVTLLYFTPQESKVFNALWRANGKVVHRDVLLGLLEESKNDTINSANVDNIVMKIKRKTSGVVRIESVSGVGHRLVR